jgi:hypothetical protein
MNKENVVSGTQYPSSPSVAKCEHAKALPKPSLFSYFRALSVAKCEHAKALPKPSLFGSTLNSSTS